MHRLRWPCRCLAPLAGKSSGGSSRVGLAALDLVYGCTALGGRADASLRSLVGVEDHLARGGLAALDFVYGCTALGERADASLRLLARVVEDHPESASPL